MGLFTGFLKAEESRFEILGLMGAIIGILLLSFFFLTNVKIKLDKLPNLFTLILSVFQTVKTVNLFADMWVIDHDR